MRTLLVAGLLFCIGCAPGIYINKEFLENDYHGKKLSVVLIDTTKITYAGSLDNEFGTERHSEKIGAYISGMVASYLKDSSVFKPVMIDFFDKKSFENNILRITGQKDSFSTRIPAPDIYQKLKDSADITLFLDSSSIYSVPYVQIVMVGFVPIPIPHKPLTISSKFLFWDNHKNVPLVWGKAAGLCDGGVAITKSEWKNAALEFAKHILRKTPFKKRR